MAYWKCEVCAYEARSEDEKQRHMKQTANEPRHVDHMKKMGKEKEKR